MNNKMTFRDVEKLSAYLDGQLSRADAARLESRLASDPGLRAVMDDLRRTRAVLRAAPKRRAPRNFTLRAESRRVRPPLPRLVPALRFASVVASLLLVFTFATNFVVPLSASRSAQPLYGMGGGGDVTDTGPMALEAPAATEEPYTAPAATGEPEMAAPAEPAPTEDSARTQEPAAKNLAPQGTQGLTPAPSLPETSPPPPIPAAWQVGLLAAAVVLATLAFLLRWLTDRRWR
ncbi:MAG: hypothetical protein AB1846_15315 [Chloroflexota bacterium]